MRDATGNSGRTTWLVLLWFLVFAGSFLAFVLIPPSDMGFTRGLNRVMPWLLGQALALGLALWSFFSARRRRASLSTFTFGLAHVPIIVIAAQLVILIILIARAMPPN